MVSDMSLGDSVQDVRSDKAEELAINGRQSPARESPFRGGVVRKDGVGVLKVSDHDQPAAVAVSMAEPMNRDAHLLTQRNGTP